MAEQDHCLVNYVFSQFTQNKQHKPIIEELDEEEEGMERMSMSEDKRNDQSSLGGINSEVLSEANDGIFVAQTKKNEGSVVRKGATNGDLGAENGNFSSLLPRLN